MIEITDMTLAHAYALAHNLRDDDRVECESLGLSAKMMLRKCWHYSTMKKTILVDGVPAVGFGLTAPLLSSVAHPWMLTTPHVENCYLFLACEYRRQVQKMLELFPVLENHCLASYTKSLNLLKLVDFQVDEPKPYGPFDTLFCKFSIGRT